MRLQDHPLGLMKHTYHMINWTYQTPTRETTTIEAKAMKSHADYVILSQELLTDI